ACCAAAVARLIDGVTIDMPRMSASSAQMPPKPNVMPMPDELNPGATLLACAYSQNPLSTVTNAKIGNAVNSPRRCRTVITLLPSSPLSAIEGNRKNVPNTANPTHNTPPTTCSRRRMIVTQLIVAYLQVSGEC